MRTSVFLLGALALACGAVALLDRESEETWEEVDKTVDATGDGNMKDFEVTPRVAKYIKHQVNALWAACNLKPSGIEVISATQATANGVAYAAQVVVSGKKHTFKFTRAHKQERRPHAPNRKKQKKDARSGSVRDRFQLAAGAFDPMPCKLNNGEAELLMDEEADPSMHFALGDVEPEPGTYLMDDGNLTMESEEVKSLPTEFDWRTDSRAKGAIAFEVLNQGSCGSCYAFAGTTAMSLRFFIKSGGATNVRLSPQEATNCMRPITNRDGCQGGSASTVYRAIGEANNGKGISDHQCTPYKGKDTRQCSPTCADKAVLYDAKGSGWSYSKQFKGEANMMKELYDHGPMYQRMAVYTGFSPGTGVYKVSSGATQRGGHAVTLIGWGTQDGEKYWVAQNSWGKNWGNQGYFKIRRGTDETFFESRGAFNVQPDVVEKCKGKARCINGGSFDVSCNCKCTGGFSGSTCASCSKSCSGEQFTGKTSTADGKCACACASGWHNSDTKECDHMMVPTTSSSSVSVAWKAPAYYYPGDMFVTSSTGSNPWSASSGWAKDSVQSYVCGSESSWRSLKNFCSSTSGTTRVAAPSNAQGKYSVWFFKYQGKNEFGQSKGWDATPVRLKCLANCNSGPAPSPPKPKPSPAPTPAAGCTDGGSQCKGWAAAGYCGKYNVRTNSGTVPLKDFCKKSCGGCASPSPGPSPNNGQEKETKAKERGAKEAAKEKATKEKAAKEKATKEAAKEKATKEAAAKAAEKRTKEGQAKEKAQKSSGGGSCSDKYPSYCGQWKERGYCRMNSMKTIYCKQTCGGCAVDLIAEQRILNQLLLEAKGKAKGKATGKLPGKPWSRGW